MIQNNLEPNAENLFNDDEGGGKENGDEENERGLINSMKKFNCNGSSTDIEKKFSHKISTESSEKNQLNKNGTYQILSLEKNDNNKNNFYNNNINTIILIDSKKQEKDENLQENNGDNSNHTKNQCIEEKKKESLNSKNISKIFQDENDQQNQIDGNNLNNSTIKNKDDNNINNNLNNEQNNEQNENGEKSMSISDEVQNENDQQNQINENNLQENNHFINDKNVVNAQNNGENNDQSEESEYPMNVSDEDQNESQQQNQINQNNDTHNNQNINQQGEGISQNENEKMNSNFIIYEADNQNLEDDPELPNDFAVEIDNFADSNNSDSDEVLDKIIIPEQNKQNKF